MGVATVTRGFPIIDVLANEDYKIGEIHNMSFEEAKALVLEMISKHAEVEVRESSATAFKLTFFLGESSSDWCDQAWNVLKEFDAVGDVRADPPLSYTLRLPTPGSASVGYIPLYRYSN